MTLPMIAQNLREGVDQHAASCGETPSFSVVNQVGMDNLLLTCQVRDKIVAYNTGYPLHRENRENGQKNPCYANTGNLEILPNHRKNTGNSVCSSCKFPDSKGKRYFDICSENSEIHKSRKLAQGKFAVRHGKKQGIHREFENAI